MLTLARHLRRMLLRGAIAFAFTLALTVPALAANTYLTGIEKVFNGTIDLDTSTFKACLVETSCTFNQDDANLTAVLARGGGELDASSGYSRQTLGTLAVTNVASTRVKWTSANVAYASVDSADTAIAIVIFYDPGTGDGNCVPIMYGDFTDYVFSSGTATTLTITCPTNGWFNYTNV